MQKVKRLYATSLIVGATFIALVFFNNCGQVSFAPARLGDEGDATVGLIDGMPTSPNEGAIVTDWTDTNTADTAADATDTATDAAADADTASTADAAADATLEITDTTTIDNIVNSLPDNVVDAPRPVTDLIDNPTLSQTYKCPGHEAVVICHFPENVEAQSTHCVGTNALKSHYGHIRTYTQEDNRTITVQDYLGPCRVSL